jgi:enoyl-CoA hydratase/carnithine racemase
MSHVHVSTEQGLAEVRIERGKVNALNEEVVDELSECFRRLAADAAVRSIVLTGTGRFFSFGFDIPGFLGHSKEAFLGYLRKFAALYRELFAHPGPVVAALNGHAVAGGCMLALACDVRLMAAGKGKIALNEITFGSSLFAGSVEMLRYCVGGRSAQQIACSGAMLLPEEALALGLVDRVVPEAELLAAAREVAGVHGAKDPAAFRSVKRLLRGPVLEEMARREEASLREFVDIWYSERTWERLREIQIRA